jgi:hypothetical protein
MSVQKGEQVRATGGSNRAVRSSTHPVAPNKTRSLERVLWAGEPGSAYCIVVPWVAHTCQRLLTLDEDVGDRSTQVENRKNNDAQNARGDEGEVPIHVTLKRS